MVFDEGNDKISAYNSASFKMQRLNKIIDLMNDVDSNLTAYNEEYHEYNYNIKFAQCENLYQEVESKLNDGERKTIEPLRKFIGNFLDENDIWKVMKRKVYPYTSTKVLNVTLFRILRDLLSKFESEVRRLVDNHGMDTNYNEEEGLF